ncbi:glyoxalase [Staphylococcus microti]|uniref:Glyoxalase n=1 Tax=Staphylococcus microti TaxID=569857 RepID=A0A0D6XRC2_9STAP|nr:VOC family protein [Staphylococcus microti]KIX91152.1 glyoxalase [Staphylococcus microti]PNZ75738.1 ring-cleaving dioxygenase [Staphylococcus microti]SUM58245.1 glyoxalase family protein [Staphylococcus microti]
MSLIQGHHHISMYTKDKEENKRFYTEILGLKLVKETVNQDDESMVHVFYGDNEGTVGTLLTFFELPNAGQMRKGTDMIARIGLLVEGEESLDYFEKRLRQEGIAVSHGTYLGHSARFFDDSEHLSYVMIDNAQRKIPNDWKHPVENDIPAPYQILGLGPIEVHVQDTATTIDYLRDELGYTGHDEKEGTVMSLDSNGLYTDIVVVEKGGPVVRPGRGYVHHHAVSVANHSALERVTALHDTLKVQHSGIIDRKWFESLYYRQNGIMYEFATAQVGNDFLD